MTREEAIAIFKGFKLLPREMKAVEMAIKALEQEPCEDAVSRQAVLDELRTCFDTHSIYDENNGENYIIYEDAVDMMEKLPAVTPSSKPSEWQQDHAILKAHSDGANEVIDRIKELRGDVSVLREERRTIECHCGCASDIADEVLELIDKLIAEVEGKNEI